MMANEILTISSTIKEAVRFIESVKALAASRSGSPTTTPSSVGSVPLTVPWTITNRYYVADVHFSAWTMDRVFAELFDRQAPALVFVWSEGQPYVKHIKEIARLMKLGEYEPEVALAVRIAGTDDSPEMEPEDESENGDIDSMLMFHGFEYVDGTRTVETASAGESEFGMEDGKDIPALPRVVDALSTIIWPSMRSNKVEPGVGGSKASLDLNHSFDEDEEKGSMLRELLNEVKDNGFSEEMKADQWKRPWISVSETSSMTATEMAMSPTEEGYDTQTDAEKVKGKVSLRFEDDFSAFVSAQAVPDMGSYDRLDDEEESGKFGDLDEVFGVLQEYKTEIAGMENEEEKRESAARVALGLVYGL